MRSLPPVSSEFNPFKIFGLFLAFPHRTRPDKYQAAHCDRQQFVIVQPLCHDLEMRIVSLHAPGVVGWAEYLGETPSPGGNFALRDPHWVLPKNAGALIAIDWRMARVAILLADGFEEFEVHVLMGRLHEAGDDAVILGQRKGRKLLGRLGSETISVRATYRDFCPEQFHGLVIPGGQSSKNLCHDAQAIEFVRLFFLTGRPVAALGDAAALLIAARVASECVLTSIPELWWALEDAGAQWVDKRVVTFGNGHLVTAQNTEDVAPFADAFIRCLRGAEALTSPREAPPETPPLDL